MNKMQMLLQILGEEAAEVTQAASKINRFGTLSVDANGDLSLTNLLVEMAQVRGVMGLIAQEIFNNGTQEEKDVYRAFNYEQEIQNKQERVLESLEISKARGLLVE